MRKNLEKIANASLGKCIWKTKKRKNHETVSYRLNKEQTIEEAKK